MGVADALGPLIDAETPKRASVETPRRLDAPTPKRRDAQTPKLLAVETPRRPELALQGAAKSTHPDYAKKTLYVRKSTMREAMYRYEGDGGAEASELVERLLLEYVRGGFRG